MASFTKRGGKWRVSICVNRIRRTETCESKAAAQQWARETETAILADARGDIPNKSFGDLLERYAREVSAHKRGARWEAVRIQLFLRDSISSVPLRTLDQRDAAAWRDRRHAAVSGSSVVRERNLLSHACTVAINEWRWLRVNPFKGVRMPKTAPPRDRIASTQELIDIASEAHTPLQIQVTYAAQFALETGMRAGEICKLKNGDVCANVATLIETKNGQVRQVPLSEYARELIGLATPSSLLVRYDTDRLIFGITAAQLDTTWRRLCDDAGVKDLHFHDLRHTAITRLAKKLTVLELARMVGHKNINQLLTYYNESAANIARKL